MDAYLPLTVLVTLTVCFLVAARPILLSARLCPALAKAGGSGCIGLGAAVVGLLAGGFVQVPGMTTKAVADEKEPQATAPSEVAEAPPAARKSSAAEADPEIDAPRDTVEIPPGRPEWVGSEPSTRGKLHTVAVSSGPYATNKQSIKALDAAIVKATNDYMADQLGSERAPQLLRAAWPSDYSARAIKKRFITGEKNNYHDVARYSVGWMHENFALLEFDPKFRNELDSRWARVRATSRLAQTGLFSGAALLLVTSVFGYFRLDNATRGYYTGRLQFMTAAAILAVVGAGAVLAQWIPWL
ncbi:MAG TPA: hypothetical protein VKH44_09300 [Pirellulaceae bacterium]|nr:hypothetical protein [Pirellulaceae bacterium]